MIHKPSMNKTVYCYDPEGYFDYEDVAQADPLTEGAFIYPPNSTEEAPTIEDGFYPKWDGVKWVNEKLPTEPSEAVGIVVSHTSMTKHDILMRQVLQDITKDSTKYVLKRGDDLSYWVEKVPDPTPEEIAQKKLEDAKSERATAVENIKVWVDGMEFDGDEKSQERLSRTITAATATGASMNDYMTWVLADNTVAQVTIAQLAQALRKAGEKQTELWTKPYEEETLRNESETAQSENESAS